jgi:ABC-type lipoprotein export system ATPase subunit
MQRVAIARALSMNPAIILADEPTGNISTVQAQEIMHILKSLQKQGHTIVIITHEPSIAAYAQRTIHIKDGKIEKDTGNKKG